MRSFPNGRVRPAQSGDIAAIEAWLPKESGVDTLAGGWRRSLRNYERGRMLVWEDALTGLPVAYSWGALNSTDSALEVAPAYRRRGIGRALVEYLIDQSALTGEPLLEVECVTEASRAFWTSVGFVLEERDWLQYPACLARRGLTLWQPLPDGLPVPVRVTFLPDNARNGGAADALLAWSGNGVRAIDGRIVLPLKLACFDLEEDRSLMVEIVVDGTLVYMGKAKHGAICGVQPCENGYQLGSVTPAWKPMVR